MVDRELKTVLEDLLKEIRGLRQDLKPELMSTQTGQRLKQQRKDLTDQTRQFLADHFSD